MRQDMVFEKLDNINQMKHFKININSRKTIFWLKRHQDKCVSDNAITT
jgi:hypothetical protein